MTLVYDAPVQLSAAPPRAARGSTPCFPGLAQRPLFVVLIAALAWTAGVATASAAGPHPSSTPAADSSYCAECHVSHRAASEEDLLRDRTDSGQVVTQVRLCYACHDGSLATNVKTGAASFGSMSGHMVEERGGDDPQTDLTDVCSDCHQPHGDTAADPGIPAAEINGVTVTGPGTAWCQACHDDAQSWYASLTPSAYPSAATPLLDTDGYPLLGRFPGSTVYNSASKNVHALIPAGTAPNPIVPSVEVTRTVGDCLYCHAPHRGVSERDGLLASYGPSSADPADAVDGDYAAVCFRCHAAPADAEIVIAGITDIKTLATGDAVDSGHTIRTTGGRYEQGSPLPCYECHNPHGSTRGNTVNINDALGQSLDPRDPADAGNVGASATKVRQFCFSCHVTNDADGVTGRPWAWDSSAGAYVPVAAGDMAIGLPRNVAVGANALRLPLATGHSLADTDRSCYGCHGDIHRPMSGVSTGGVACSTCHSALNGMVDDTATYHHVLDDPAWDQAPDAGGTYPTSTTSLACVSCHVDHSDYESLPADDPGKADGKAYSLRSSATVANPTPSDTDDTLCLSCHAVELARNTTGQKANVITETRVWSVDAALWTDSPHNYDSPGPFNDGSIFNANCAKCHGNLQGTLSSGKFSVHFSAEQRLLNALGDTPNATLAVNEEQMCFRCHSKASDALAGTKKPSDYVDWYGTQAMSESNVVIYAQMNATANTHGHKPHAYQNLHLLAEADETQSYISANKHVECADCHNHHVVGDSRHEFGTTNAVSEAIRGVRGVAFNTAALATTRYPTDAQVNARLTTKSSSDYEYEICLKCHSSANTNYNTATWGGTKTSVSNVGNAKPYGWTTYTGPSPAVTTPRWTNVASDFNLGNQSRHPVFAPLPATDPWLNVATNGTAAPAFYGSSRVTAGQLAAGWKPGDTMYCSDCHGDPNAPTPWLLDINGNVVLDANGDPTVNPAMADYAQGPHGSSVAYSLRGPRTDWPIATTGPQAGQLITMNMLTNTTYDNLFCSNCHPGVRVNKVHGGGGGRHAAAACVNCHTLSPHGGGMSRLIADGDGSMPARFSYNNDKRTSYIASFNKRSDPSTYVRADCQLTPTARAAAICGTQHAGGSNPNQENW